MLQPKVSCVCPTYGRVRTLGEALDSFLRQTYTPRELVILNDAPVAIEDVRGAGLQKVTRLDCGGGYWTDGQGVEAIVVNAPLFETLGDKYNALLKLASGDVIAHWEDDDLWFPNHLAVNVGRLLADPGLECVKNETAWVLERFGRDAQWRYAGWNGNVFESQMVFWRAAAEEIGYAKSHQRQSLYLFEEFGRRKTVAQHSVHPWNTYVYRWDTSFLHGQLIDVEKWSIEKWRETNREFGSVLERRSCSPYLSLVLRDLDAASAKPPLSAADAALVRAWLGPTLPTAALGGRTRPGQRPRPQRPAGGPRTPVGRAAI
jgi:hypothetical protein